ncbi:MAG TPA: aromatic ring-opening dioxygenase LigA [Dehalococcoidia bacterium]|nr:aromatic ring-opening dioxygenase LigA [Dehalococcoidia bacterium]
MSFLTRWAWIGAVAFGIALVGAGVFMVSEARSAHDEVRDALASERIVTAEDAEIPLASVDSAAEAKAQADIIQVHALRITEGKTYAELDRNDPRRNTYLQAVTLRTALMESYLAFKVSDLVAGVGVIVALLGASHVVLGLYLGLVTAPQKRRVAAVNEAALASI